MSDLHLEVDPEFVPEPAPEADLLVLAGDIGALPETPLGRHGADDWHLTRFSPARGHWPVPVLYVPGNHEYDGYDFRAAHTRLRAQVEALGIVWLERETVIIDGVRFLGTTLWTDFDCFADPAGAAPERDRAAREAAFEAANYFLERAATSRDGALYDAQAMREEGLRCQTWLRGALAAPHPGPTVVVTHFAPSLASHDPRYGLTPGTAGFCNALDALAADADLWLHGHLHCRSDYRLGRCRVVANPRGYAAQGEQEGFLSRCLVEV